MAANSYEEAIPCDGLGCAALRIHAGVDAKGELLPGMSSDDGTAEERIAATEIGCSMFRLMAGNRCPFPASTAAAIRHTEGGQA